MGLEGIMAKRGKSRYLPGKRSDNWVKVKVRQTVDVAIIGYTKGNGDRKDYFGALQIAEKAPDGWTYRGKVGSGFDQKSLKNIYGELQKIQECPKVIREKPLDNANTKWIEPTMFCEVEYASITPNDTYREPVFVRLRPDITY